MAKKKKSVPYIHNGVAHAGDDDGEYRSPSSIDNPPRETLEASFNEDGQAEIPGAESTDPSYESKFKFSLALTVNSGLGSDKLTVVSGEAPAQRIEEIINKAVTAKRFLRKLRGVIGEPLFPTVESPEIDGEVTSQAGLGEGSGEGENF